MIDLISIVVPVYNSEKYLRECLESIINQTYKNLQIILVDDCSTDNSGKICEEYAVKDSRIEVYRPKKNGGQSSSRNLGLKHAKGEWIAFADNDDTLESEMLETLLANAKKYNCKISGCAHNIVENGKIIEVVKPVNWQEGVNSSDYFVINAMYRPKNAWIDVWTKLYHKSLKDKLNFPEGCQMEDFSVNLRLFYEVKEFCFTDKALYNWRILSDSQSHVKFFKNRITYYKVSEDIRKWFVKQNASEDFLKAAYIFEYCCKTQLLLDMVNSKDKENIKFAKSKIKDVDNLSKNIKVSNEFKIKSDLAYKLRRLKVKLY